MDCTASPLVPNDTQREAIESGKKHFISNDKGMLVASCGSGKTLISMKIVESFSPPARRIIIFVPTRLLLKQTVEDWKRSFDPEGDKEFIAVCSDLGSKGDLSKEALEGEGLQITTCPEELRDVLMKKVKTGQTQIIVSTYQSASVVRDAQRVRKFETSFDVLICDEAHHTAGSTDKDGRSREFQLPLDNAEIRASRRLFMTATPQVIPPLKKERRDRDTMEKFGVEKKEIFSMDDAEKYGRIFFELTLRQAIENDTIPVCPYRVVPHFIRKSDVAFICDPVNRLSFSSLNPETAASMYVLVDLMDTRTDFGATHVITYHRLTRDASNFCAGLDVLNQDREGNEPNFQTSYLDGSMKMDHRKKILQHFSASDRIDYHVLSNCKALTEGLNVPSANALLFADGKSSVIEIMQAIGRIIRKEGSEGKVGTVVVPLIVDDTVPDKMTVTEESQKRFRQILFAGKLVDSKITERIEVPDHMALGVAPHPARDFEGSRYGRMQHEERGWLASAAVQKFIEEVKTEIASVAARTYKTDNYEVAWNPMSSRWRLRIRNPWYDLPGKNPNQMSYGTGAFIRTEQEEFVTAEDAALFIDSFIRKNGLEWDTNFGHNDKSSILRTRKNITPRFPKQVSYSPSRDDWRAYLDMMVPDEDGNPKKVKPNVYFKNPGDPEKAQNDAIAAYNAIAMRYGTEDRLIADKFGEIEPNFNLIVGKLCKKFPLGRNPYPPGVEEDSYYAHTSDKKFWAYTTDALGKVTPIGYFPTVEMAASSVMLAGQRKLDMASKSLL